MIRKISIAVFLLLCIGTVAASTPDWRVDFLDQKNLNATGVVARALFTKQPYIPTIYNLSTYAPTTIQQYDRIRWTGNTSINLYGSNHSYIANIGTNVEYVFAVSGIFSYEQNGDPNQTAEIIVSSVPNAIVSINASIVSPFLISVAPSSFELSDNEQSVNITITVPQQAVPGNFTYNLTIASANKSIFANNSFLLLERKFFIVAKDSVLKTTNTRAGTTEAIGEIQLVNDGNVNFNVTIITAGNGSPLIQVQKEAALYKGLTTLFSFISQVPQRQQDGNYIAEISVRGGESRYDFNISINVHDEIPPTIDKIEFKDNFVYHDNEVVVTANDNLNVTKVEIFYNGSKHEMAKDQQLFIFRNKFVETATLVLQICAFDAANNSYCEDTNKTLQKLDIATMVGDDIAMPAKKAGKFSRKFIFTLNESAPIPIAVKITNLESDLVVERQFDYYSVKIEDADGAEQIFANINSSIDITKKGDYYLVIRGENVSEYSGSVLLTMPDIIVGPKSFSFSGKMLDYDLPEPFDVEWYGKNVSCGVFDSGDLETSEYDCHIRYSIAQDLKSLAIPTTPAEKQLYDENTKMTIAEWSRKVDNRNKAIAAMIGLMIFLFATIVWAGKIYPIWRGKYG